MSVRWFVSELIGQLLDLIDQLVGQSVDVFFTNTLEYVGGSLAKVQNNDVE